MPCGASAGHDSEVFLVPRAIYRDPFRGGKNILVMCDTYKPPEPGKEAKNLEPLPTNTRYAAAAAMEKAKAEEPWFGIEQVDFVPLHPLHMKLTVAGLGHFTASFLSVHASEHKFKHAGYQYCV